MCWQTAYSSRFYSGLLKGRHADVICHEQVLKSSAHHPEIQTRSCNQRKVGGNSNRLFVNILRVIV